MPSPLRTAASATPAARFAVVALIVAGLAALPAAAYASPPDASWVAGFYDDADYDDIVALIASTAADLGPAAVPHLRLAPLSATSLSPTTAGPTRVSLLAQVPPRAPPRTASSPLPVHSNIR